MPQQHTVFTVRRMCRLLAVSRRGYYEWLRRPPGAPEEAAPQVGAKVQHYCAQGRGTYGPRRLKYLVAQDGRVVSRRRIGRVLAQAGLRCKTRRRFKAPTATGHAQTVAPHQLNRAFTVPKPATVSVGDMTSLPTGAGWRYLAIVRELGSRAVVGWAMANHLRAALVNRALALALCQRHLAAGLIRHTDRGSQYGAER
jgi:transposase InsO family protein